MNTKRRKKGAFVRAGALALGFFMLAPYVAKPLKPVFAYEKSDETQTTNPTYGNERVSGSDYSQFPMTAGGEPEFSYGNDTVGNGDFNGIAGNEDLALSNNLVEGNGDYSGIVKLVSEVGTSQNNTVAGAYGNRNWADGYAQIVYQGDDPVARISNRGPAWSHLLVKMNGRGKGVYTVGFDYNNFRDFNAYVAIGNIEKEVWATTNDAEQEAGLFSAPGWLGLNAGEPIENREGWYRYTQTYTVDFDDDVDAFRVWVYVGANAAGNTFLDNISVTFKEENGETENLIEGGGTFDGVLDNSGTVGISAENAVGGVWTNPNWSDSYGRIVNENGNDVLRIGHTEDGGEWAHALHNFRNHGAGDYVLEFDYYNSGNVNAYVQLMSDTFDAANTNMRYGDYNATDANLFSAPGWLSYDAGRDIGDGWRRFSATIHAAYESFSVIRFWAYVGTDTENYIDIDNISIRFVTEEMSKSGNLVVDGGTFEGALTDGESLETGNSYDSSVHGVWTNPLWADSYGVIAKEEDNTVLKVGYADTGYGWAHAFVNFANNGAGVYQIDFDYYAASGANVYFELRNSLNIDQVMKYSWGNYVMTANYEYNVLSGTDWLGYQAGTDIAGGWKHFSAPVYAENGYCVLAFRVWTNFNADNYLLVDNLDVEALTPASALSSYTLQDDDPSGWSTTGSGVVSMVDHSYALTIASEEEATTTKSVNQRAGSYLLSLAYKAEADATFALAVNGIRYDLLSLGGDAADSFTEIAFAFTTDQPLSEIVFVTKGTVVLDNVTLRSAEINYNAETDTVEKALFEGENLAVGGGTFEGYLESDGTVEVETTANSAKMGIWSNAEWTDSPATVVKEGDETYVKLAYKEGAGTYAHVIQSFANDGVGNYLVAFDYHAEGTTDNCYAIVNDNGFVNTDAGMNVVGRGTAIADREGWYHVESTVYVASTSMQYLRIWYSTQGRESNYLLIDNISVKIQTGTEITGTGEYAVPEETPVLPAGMWSFATDTPAVLTRDGDNAVVRMYGDGFSSFYYGFQFERSGVYAFDFDFKYEGVTDNLGVRVNPVEEKYTFDIPLLQYRAQWKASSLGEGWYHFTYYIDVTDEPAYKDASVQFWVLSNNRAAFTVDNVSVRRLLSADVTGNPVWGRQLIADGGFETVLGNRESYTLPSGRNEVFDAVSSVWTEEGSNPVRIVIRDDLYVARLAGKDGFAEIAHKLQLQNEGLYRVMIRYTATSGYAAVGGTLTYALGSNPAEDILTGAVEDNFGYRIFTQYVKMTAEEADAIEKIAVRANCIDGYEVLLDYVSVCKEVGSDIPQEQAPEEDITGKVRYDLVSGGDFEGYAEGASFGEEVTVDMFGTTSLDMPATVVTNDKDSYNSSKVLLLQHLEGSSKDFSSAFNLYPSKAELERGRTYYMSFDYKYHIDEPLDTSLVVSDGRRFTMDNGFTFCFVGGTNIGHHEIWLGSVKNGDLTVGANNQKVVVTKTELEEGWARITFSFTANTGLTVACNSFRFLLLTNGNPNNYAMFDNVQLYTYYESGETPPDNPPIDPDTPPKDDPSIDPSDNPKEENNIGLVIGLSVGAVVAVAAISVAVVILKKKKSKGDSHNE